MSKIKELIGATLMAARIFSKPDDHKVLSVYFHNPGKRLFEGMIQWLHKKGYRFISVQELEELILSRKKPGKRTAFISFDDGNREYPELIPVIEKYQVPITVFIPTNPVLEGNYWWDYAGHPDQQNYTGLENVEAFKTLPVREFDLKVEVLKNHLKLERTCMTLDELKQFARHPLVTIGAHTVSHPILKNCDTARQDYELKEGQQRLNEWLNQFTCYLAYPNGDYNQETLELAKKHQYRLAFTTKPGQIDTTRVITLEIPRYSINDEGGYYENLSKMNGYWQKLFPPK
jgi:peptidoglycan/xylan/chitin deacetylase (PgdA/CDA1 family)